MNQGRTVFSQLIARADRLRPGLHDDRPLPFPVPVIPSGSDPWLHQGLLDPQGSIPTNLWITTAFFADNRILDALLPEPGSIHIMDRGYLDFARLAHFEPCRAVFVVHAKRDESKGEAWTYLTSDFDLPALTVTELYRSRWQVELFFKWIKQHLRIKAFYGNSANAVRTQIWIAVTSYVFVAILRRRLGIELDLYTLLQILNVYVFEKVPLPPLLTSSIHTLESGHIRNQWSLCGL